MLNSQPIHPITQKLKQSGLVEAVTFPMDVQAPELVRECIKRYNLETKQILLPDQSILLSINKALMQSAFGIPVKEEYCDIDVSSSTSMFNKKKTLRREDMQRTWFQTPCSKKSKMPRTLFGTNLRREIVDILALLLRLKGKEEILDFIEHHFFLVQAICAEVMQIDWAQIICDELASWLNSAKAFEQFYMSSYLIYALATNHLWPGLPNIEDYDENTRVYEFYTHLQLQRSFKDYVKVNDALTMRLCRESQGCPERRFSPEAISAIGQFRCPFIQFLTFSYLRIGAFDGFP